MRHRCAAEKSDEAEDPGAIQPVERRLGFSGSHIDRHEWPEHEAGQQSEEDPPLMPKARPDSRIGMYIECE